MGKAGDTIISDSYAPFGTTVTGPPSRPDKSSEERRTEEQRNRVTYSEVLKRFGWTKGDFDVAKTYPKFPQIMGWTGDGWNGAREACYRWRDFERWREEVLAFAAKVK